MRTAGCAGGWSPLTWLWAMVHGMWPLGIGIGRRRDRRTGARPRPAGRPSTGRALLVPALSAVAAALTPVGPQLYGAVLVVGSRKQYFAEWSTPGLQPPVGCWCWARSLVLTMVVMARQRPAWLVRPGLPGRGRGVRRVVVADRARVARCCWCRWPLGRSVRPVPRRPHGVARREKAPARRAARRGAGCPRRRRAADVRRPAGATELAGPGAERAAAGHEGRRRVGLRAVT